MKYLIFLLFLALICCRCNVEDQGDWSRLNVPEEYTNSVNDMAVESRISDSILEVWYPIVQSLPLNYDTTGNSDYTNLIQGVLDEHKNIVFPNFPFFINSEGLTLRSNSKIIFDKGSKLFMQSNSKERYEVLRLHEVQNVELYSPNIIGDRDKHIGSAGEWGFGISIRGSQKIKVYQAEVKNCWGDGIYLGSINDSLVNTDIKIEDCFIDNNRRNGISITSGINIDIVNCFISNTNGTAPEGGIDIEPNNNQEFLDNINIINTTTFNNVGIGLAMVFIHFQGPKHKNVKINVKNHVDESSLYGMGLALGDLNNDFAKIEGSIDVTNSVWKNNKRGLVAIPDFNNNMINLNIVMPKATHTNPDIARIRMEELIRICEEEESFSFSE